VTAVRTAETGFRRISLQARLPSAASDQPEGVVARSGPDRSAAGPLRSAAVARGGCGWARRDGRRRTADRGRARGAHPGSDAG